MTFLGAILESTYLLSLVGFQSKYEIPLNRHVLVSSLTHPQIFFSEDASTTQRGIATATRRLDFRQPEERVWERLCSAHSFGDCLITISTCTARILFSLESTHVYVFSDNNDARRGRCCRSGHWTRIRATRRSPSWASANGQAQKPLGSKAVAWSI